MDLLKSDIKKTYLRYLITSFGSAIITSIYGLVDMAMIGQYYGPKGSSAMAVVAPVWNLIYSLGLLVGIGGSIVYSHIKGYQETKFHFYYINNLWTSFRSVGFNFNVDT